jgi:hypothetical protein
VGRTARELRGVVFTASVVGFAIVVVILEVNPNGISGGALL